MCLHELVANAEFPDKVIHDRSVMRRKTWRKRGTDSARSPSACCAAHARYAESAPPDSATITEERSASRVSNSRSFCSADRGLFSGSRMRTSAFPISNSRISHAAARQTPTSTCKRLLNPSEHLLFRRRHPFPASVPPIRNASADPQKSVPDGSATSAKVFKFAFVKNIAGSRSATRHAIAVPQLEKAP